MGVLYILFTTEVPVYAGGPQDQLLLILPEPKAKPQQAFGSSVLFGEAKPSAAHEISIEVPSGIFNTVGLGYIDGYAEIL